MVLGLTLRAEKELVRFHDLDRGVDVATHQEAASRVRLLEERLRELSIEPE